MIQYLHVFRLVVTIHQCNTAFCVLWLYFNALSRIGKRLSVFKKLIFLMASVVKKRIHLVKNMQPSGLLLTSIHSVEQWEFLNIDLKPQEGRVVNSVCFSKWL